MAFHVNFKNFVCDKLMWNNKIQRGLTMIIVQFYGTELKKNVKEHFIAFNMYYN